jgi:hypothetical protein
MVESVDLSAISDYFDSKVVLDRDFMNAGVVASHERLLSIVRVSLSLIVRDTRPIERLLIRIAEHDFWHGMLLLRSGLMAQIIYFEDANRGLCTTGSLSSSLAHHVRFSIPDDMVAPVEPEGAKIVHFARRQIDSKMN